MTPMPNYLSTHLSLFTTHLLMSGACGDGKSGKDEAVRRDEKRKENRWTLPERY